LENLEKLNAKLTEEEKTHIETEVTKFRVDFEAKQKKEAEQRVKNAFQLTKLLFLGQINDKQKENLDKVNSQMSEEQHAQVAKQMEEFRTTYIQQKITSAVNITLLVYKNKANEQQVQNLHNILQELTQEQKDEVEKKLEQAKKEQEEKEKAAVEAKKKAAAEAAAKKKAEQEAAAKKKKEAEAAAKKRAEQILKAKKSLDNFITSIKKAYEEMSQEDKDTISKLTGGLSTKIVDTYKELAKLEKENKKVEDEKKKAATEAAAKKKAQEEAVAKKKKEAEAKKPVEAEKVAEVKSNWSFWVENILYSFSKLYIGFWTCLLLIFFKSFSQGQTW